MIRTKLKNKGLKESDLKNLREIKSNLFKIQERGTAPINLVKYRNMGLIKPINVIKDKTSTFGVRDTHFSKLRLTDKGKRILKTNF